MRLLTAGGIPLVPMQMYDPISSRVALLMFKCCPYTTGTEIELKWKKKNKLIRIKATKGDRNRMTL
jgi:hypothetical protein